MSIGFGFLISLNLLCTDNKSVIYFQVGLWKLPSTALFQDFCKDLARNLQHDYIKAYASDVTQDVGEGYIVSLKDGTEILSSSVVLALGQNGMQVVPNGLVGVPKNVLMSWDRMKESLQPHHESALVVGGGLTAVQSAQYCLRQGKKVVLCSRRPLVERHFDIDECWFDKRTANKHIAEFYHQNESERIRQLREVRGGGSVPPLYMDDLRKWEKNGQLIVVNQVDPGYICRTEDGKLLIDIGNEVKFDCVVLACGVKTNCIMNPLVKRVHENFPIEIVEGFPNISVNLEWSKNLYVVGALAGLNVGPDAANIMGARRAATIVANAIGSKNWLRQNDGALSNKFGAFACLDDDDSTSDSSDE